MPLTTVLVTGYEPFSTFDRNPAALVARGLDPLPSLPLASTAVSTVVRLQAEAQALAHGWGVSMVPFPGMAYP